MTAEAAGDRGNIRCVYFFADCSHSCSITEVIFIFRLLGQQCLYVHKRQKYKKFNTEHARI